MKVIRSLLGKGHAADLQVMWALVGSSYDCRLLVTGSNTPLRQACGGAESLLASYKRSNRPMHRFLCRLQFSFPSRARWVIAKDELQPTRSRFPSRHQTQSLDKPLATLVRLCQRQPADSFPRSPIDHQHVMFWLTRRFVCPPSPAREEALSSRPHADTSHRVLGLEHPQLDPAFGSCSLCGVGLPSTFESTEQRHSPTSQLGFEPNLCPSATFKRHI